MSGRSSTSFLFITNERAVIRHVTLNENPPPSQGGDGRSIASLIYTTVLPGCFLLYDLTQQGSRGSKNVERENDKRLK